MNKEFLKKMSTAFETYRGSAEQITLNQRLVDNEKWYRLMQHNGKEQDSRIPPTCSGYLFNAILTKHADAMDNYPDVSILPREESDKKLADTLTGVIPCILDLNDFESVYSDNWYSKLKTSSCYCVLWDSDANGGKGEIKISKTDLLHLYWQPGISDIQDSEFVFYESFMPVHEFKQRYGEGAFELCARASKCDTYDEIQMSFKQEMVHVIDCYYKIISDDNKDVLHFCKFSGEYVIFSSEDKTSKDGKKLFPNGYYDHGQYPFVFDVLYPAEQSLAGFGICDVLKPMQMYVDALNSLIQVNNRLIGKPRYIVSKNLGVNIDDFTDVEKEILESDVPIDPNMIFKIEVDPIPSQVNHSMEQMIAMMKEIIGNRDFQQGGTSNGVTSGTALTVMQSVGDKLSRDMIKSSYRKYKKIVLFMIELFRQFYTEERTMRITGKDGDYEFIKFDNSDLNPGSVQKRDFEKTNYSFSEDLGIMPGAPVGIDSFNENDSSFKPYFDVKLSVQKSNPYSRELSNQTILELANTGLFAPDRLEFNMPILKALQFEGKDALIKDLSDVLEKMKGASSSGSAGDGSSGNVNVPGANVPPGVMTDGISDASSAAGNIGDASMIDITDVINSGGGQPFPPEMI